MSQRKMMATCIAVTLMLFAWSAPAQDANGDSAIAAMRAAAEKDDPAAQFKLARYYSTNAKFPGDGKISTDLLKRSAGQDYPDAEFWLGIAYENGVGVEENQTEAFKWYLKAANHGNAKAENSVAMAYMNGRGINQDTEKGFEWYRKATDQSDPDAEIAISLIYLNGYYGVKQDDVQSVKWATLAASHGSDMGRYILAIAYITGRGVEPNVEKGMTDLQKLAQKGNPEAIAALQHMQQVQQMQQMQQQRTAVPVPTPAPYRAPSNADIPAYGSSNTNQASQSTAPARMTESAGLYKEQGAGGGYLTCYYSTGSGYRFTTTSSDSSCPGTVEVDPQSGQAW